MKGLNRELAATVLLEAMYTTDELACKKYDVDERTLRRWRKSLTEDLALADILRQKQEAFNKQWAEEFPLALREATQTLRDCFKEIRKDPKAMKNPELISSVAGAVKICADVSLTSKVIDARIAQHIRPQGQVFGQGTTSAEDGGEPDYPN